MNRRLFCSLIAAAFAFVLLAPSAADAATARFPRLVLARTADARLLDHDRRPQPIPVGLLLDVHSADGDSLWVGRGWVAQADVVAVDEAVEHFTTAIAAEPTPFAYVSRGRARTQLGEHTEAEADCRAALALEPNYAPAHAQLGRVQTALRQPNAALESLDRAIKLDPNSAIAYCCRAQTRQAMGDAATALVDYDRAIALDARLVVAFFHRSGIRSQHGDEPGALDDLTEVVIQHPDHFLALNNRGNLWAGRQQWDYAITDYTAALKVAQRGDIFMNRARALQASGRASEAIADCNEAIRLDPHSERAFRRRASLLEQLGRMDEAGADLERAERLASAGSRT